MRIKVCFVSAPCGSGKTYAACQFIRDHRFCANHIYVAPTLKLIEETRKTLENMGVAPTVITHETHAGHVKGQIIKFFNDSYEMGQVLLITWNAYVDLRYINRRGNWQIIIDEVPQIDRFYGWRLPRNLTFLTDDINLDETAAVNDRLAKVLVKDANGLRDRMEGVRDDVDDNFRGFFSDLLCTNTDMFVDVESWNRLVEKGDFTDDDATNRLFFISMLRPEPFKDVILLGANIEDSLLHRWLTGYHGCQFVEHTEIAAKLRKPDPNLSARLKISHFIPARHASKALFKKTDTSGANLIDSMDRLALDTFGSAPFLYVKNKDRKSPLDGQLTAIPVPVVAHGLNTYEQHTNIYFSAALNREPKHFEMLKSLGLHADHVHQASAHEMLYQCVMRTSLRDPASSAIVHAIVPDEPSAMRLAHLVGTKQVSQLGAICAPPRPALTDIQRRQRHEASKAIARLYAPKTTRNWYINEDRVNPGTFLQPQSPLNSPTCFVTLHRDAFAAQPAEHLVKELSINDFLALLRKQAKAIRDRKEDAAFFNPCVFEPPPRSSGYRKIDYFRQSSFLVLDFDDGNLSPEEFERIFWHEARRGQKRSFVICNSFSRSPDKPNKFRVIMFYKRPAMSLFQHKAVLESVVARLEKHGYSKQSAKLDPACWSGVQSFYWPCTNRDHQEWAFFRTHGTKGRDIERCAIDPVLFGITYIQPNPVLAASLKPVIVSTVSRQQIDDATANLRSLTRDRHRPIFDTGLALCQLGLSSTEVEAELVFAVGSDSRMRRKVSDAMKSLERYGWFSWRRWLPEAAAPHPFVGAG